MSAILVLFKMAVLGDLVSDIPRPPCMSTYAPTLKSQNALPVLPFLSLTSFTQLRTFVEVQLKTGLWADLSGLAASQSLLERNGPQEMAQRNGPFRTHRG